MNADAHKIKCALDDTNDNVHIVHTARGTAIITQMFGDYLLRVDGISLFFDQYTVENDTLKVKFRGWYIGGIQF